MPAYDRMPLHEYYDLKKQAVIAFMVGMTLILFRRVTLFVCDILGCCGKGEEEVEEKEKTD